MFSGCYGNKPMLKPMLKGSSHPKIRFRFLVYAGELIQKTFSYISLGTLFVRSLFLCSQFSHSPYWMFNLRRRAGHIPLPGMGVHNAKNVFCFRFICNVKNFVLSICYVRIWLFSGFILYIWIRFVLLDLFCILGCVLYIGCSKSTCISEAWLYLF